jgi:DNA primase
MDQHFDVQRVNDLLREAAGPTRRSTKTNSRRPIDFRATRQRIAITQVLEDVLGWHPSSKYGAQLRGPCPLHKGSANSKSFVVNKDRGLWYCHSSCKTGGNAIDLFAAAMGMKDDLYAAAVLLCERLGVVPVYLPPSDKRKG